MKKEDENSLLIVNDNNVFYKIKNFFRNLFGKGKKANNITPIEKQIIETEEMTSDEKSGFREIIKETETDETRLLKLQRDYESGNVKEKELTEKQVNDLLELYQKQIDELRSSNERRKKKLLEYRKNAQKAV